MANKIKNKAVPSDAKHRFEFKVSDLKLKWDVSSVIPENTIRPDESIAVIEGDTTFPVSRDKAVLKIWAEHNNKKVNYHSKFKLSGNKIVNSDDDLRPKKQFTLSDGIWSKWDKLNYHVTGKIDTLSVDTEQALKVKRWHVQAINTSESPAILAFRNQESANYDNSFSGCADDAHHSWKFNAGSSDITSFADLMMNTYSFNYTGHGNVICGVCERTVYDGIESGTDAEFGRFTVCPNDSKHNKPISAHCVGPFPWIQREDIKNDVPETPKYLVYSVCCGGAFESSLFDAYISRGTKYAIGFKKSTRCDWARDYSQQLFDAWIQTHGADPSKIPDVFNSLYTTWSAKLEPVLFGKYFGIGSHLRDVGRSIAKAF